MDRSRFFCALCMTARRTRAATLLAASITYSGISHRRSTREWFYSGLAQKGQTQQQSDCEDTLHDANHQALTPLCPDLQVFKMLTIVCCICKLFGAVQGRALETSIYWLAFYAKLRNDCGCSYGGHGRLHSSRLWGRRRR